MARKSTIGTNPLDSVIPDRRADPQAAPAPARKEQTTFQLPADLLDRARNAVFWTPGASLAGLMEEALAKHLDSLERAHGKPFPPRRGSLKTGRPIKS